jgi:hypothetical protein
VGAGIVLALYEHTISKGGVSMPDVRPVLLTP